MWKLFLLLVFIYIPKSSEACSCVPTHPQTTICDAAFAIKGTTLSVFHETWTDKDVTLPNDPEELFNFMDYKYRYYLIKVKQVFKGSMHKGEIITVRIPGSGSLCGFRLNDFPGEKTTWLLTGTISDDGWYTTDVCSFNNEWRNVTAKQKDYLKKEKYVYNCDCPVVRCFQGGSCGPSDRYCVHYEPESKDCYIRNLYCKKSLTAGAFKCGWQGPFLVSCVQNNPHI